jgi:prephenate dehydrogenase
MTADEHDRLVARTSHLPQIVSSALAACTEGPAHDLAGPGLEDMTRLALSDAAMWRDILLANADNLLEAARALTRELEAITSAVGSGEGETIARLMEDGRRAAVALREATA